MTKKIQQKTEPNSLSDFDTLSFPSLDDTKTMDLKGWSRSAKEDFLREKIRQILFIHGWEGLTATEVAHLANLTEPTARRHLDRLSSIREAYSIKRKANLTLYYPNGKPLHGFGKYKIEHPPFILESVLAEGPGKKILVHITEKRYSILDGETTEGGVLVPLELIPKLIDNLKSLMERGSGIDGI